jgi:hypothetical protein
LLTPPSSEALGISRLKTKRYDLHCKNVKTLDFDKLVRLPGLDPNIAKELRELGRWLKDPAKYKKVPKPAKVHTTRIPGAHLKKVEEYEKAERAPPGTEARSSIKVFTTPEPHKNRERLIEHPVDINDATKDDVDKTKFLPHAERHNVLLCEDGVMSADVDASSWFDHFGLGEEVRDFYAFLYRGELWRFKVLPMGLHHSVAIAHTATRMLLNYDMKGVHAEPYIDNIRFVGKPEEVVEAMSTFLLRCKAVCVT